jgi:hypothetical protein
MRPPVLVGADSELVGQDDIVTRGKIAHLEAANALLEERVARPERVAARAQH